METLNNQDLGSIGTVEWSADHWRLIAEQLPAVLWTTDKELRFTSSFGVGLADIGLKPGQVVGQTLQKFFQADERGHPAIAAHRRALDGEHVSFDIVWLDRVFDVHVEPLRSNDGSIIGCIGVALDVTARIRAEEALNQRIEAESVAIDISRRFAGAQWDDTASALDMALERLAHHLGAEHAEILLESADGTSYDVHYRWDDPTVDRIDIPYSVSLESVDWLIRQLTIDRYVLVPDVRTLPESVLRSTAAGHPSVKSAAWIGIEIDGHVAGGITLLWYRAAASVTDAQVAPLTVLADVVAALMHRRTVEERLNESRRMMSSLMSNLPGMAYRCRNDHDWTLEYASDGCLGLTGYSADELVNHRTTTYNDLILPEDRAAVWRDVQTGVNNRTAFQLVYRIKDRTGTVKWVWEQGAGVYDAGGNVIALEGFITDINDAKRSEIERQKFVALVENSSDGVIMCTLAGRTLYMNSAGRELLGIGQDEDVTLRSMSDWYCACHGGVQPESLLIEAKTSGQWIGEMSLQHQVSGARIPVRQNVFLVRQAEGDAPLCIAAVLHDLREEKHAEELLMRAKRLESAGQLAGQIAHDFNNLLGPLVAYPSLIRSRVEDTSEIEEMLCDMEEAARRIAEINQELLTLGRRGHYNVHAVDINRIVEQTMRSLSIPDHVRVVTKFHPHIAPVLGGGAQLVRAFSNVISNSCDAMRKGGTLTLTTDKCRLSNKQLRGRTVKSGEYVRIDIADTGHGIPSDIINRVFDPFFTTRKADKGRGSGLGLAVVYSVIEDHEGYLDVTSEPGEGTTFSVYLPIAPEAIEPPKPRHNVPRGNGERILVVDDDLMQLRIVEHMLSDLDYEIETAASGSEAVHRIRTTEFDLVLLDMQMDGIDGAETFRQMRLHRPTQRALIISGYAGTDRVASALASGVIGFIQKPVEVVSLARAVHHALQNNAVSVRRHVTP